MRQFSWRRTGVLSVALATVVATLAGCSSGSSAASTPTAQSTDTTGQTLNYWLWVDNATNQTWQQLANQFNAESGHGKVQLQIVPAGQYLDKLQTALSSGTGPDAARMKDEWIGSFVKSGVLAPLSKQIDAWSGKSSVIPSAWNAGKIPGSSEVYMMPHQNTALYMY